MKRLIYKLAVPSHYQHTWNPSKQTKVIGSILFWYNLQNSVRRTRELVRLREENDQFRAELGLPPRPDGPVTKWIKEQTARLEQR